MEKRSCKLCFRTFANGRALGGHMRSHLALAKPDRQRRASLPPPPPSPSPTPSASSTSSHEAAEGYVLRENPRRSFRLVDPEFSSTLPALDAGSSSVVQDRESETESPRAAPGVRRLRSGRRRRAAPDPEPASSVSDATTEEDVALSLMMLSRDAWAIAAAAAAPDDDDDDEESEIEGRRVVPAAATRQQGKGGRSRHQCGTCRKVFRSYQALGGHRASHKRSNGCVPVANADPEADKSHECPVCFRVFPSGQALGGHKRSHLAAFGATAAAPPTPTMTVSCSSPAAPKLGESFIDLNLPAPVDDDFELSAVSDAGFAAFRRT